MTFSCHISWTYTPDPSAPPDGFAIHRMSNVASWSEIARVGADIREYTDSPLDYGKSYTYRIAPYNMQGYSTWSPTSSLMVTIPVPPPVISAPTTALVIS